MMLKFYKAPDANDATKILSNRLVQELQAGKHVAWLVCGGSNIPPIIKVMQSIPTELTPKLTLLLTDERYGERGHPDSNWHQLFQAGFNPVEAEVIPTLAPNLSLEETCKQYERAVVTSLGNADVTIAQFGIGADGHIAGILPHSPGVNNKSWVVGYDAGTFTRITLTLTALRNIDAAYAFVYGDAKHPVLQQLQSEAILLDDQPAQILKEMPEAYICNDYVGDSL